MDDGSSSDEQVQIICDYLIEEAKDNQSKETQKAKGDSSASIAQPSTSTGGWTNSKSSRNEQIKSPNPINTECDTDIRTILETILNSHIKPKPFEPFSSRNGYISYLIEGDPTVKVSELHPSRNDIFKTLYKNLKEKNNLNHRNLSGNKEKPANDIITTNDLKKALSMIAPNEIHTPYVQPINQPGYLFPTRAFPMGYQGAMPPHIPYQPENNAPINLFPYMYGMQSTAPTGPPPQVMVPPPVIQLPQGVPPPSQYVPRPPHQNSTTAMPTTARNDPRLHRQASNSGQPDDNQANDNVQNRNDFEVIRSEDPTLRDPRKESSASIYKPLNTRYPPNRWRIFELERKMFDLDARTPDLLSAEMPFDLENLTGPESELFSGPIRVGRTSPKPSGSTNACNQSNDPQFSDSDSNAEIDWPTAATDNLPSTSTKTDPATFPKTSNQNPTSPQNGPAQPDDVGTANKPRTIFSVKLNERLRTRLNCDSIPFIDDINLEQNNLLHTENQGISEIQNSENLPNVEAAKGSKKMSGKKKRKKKNDKRSKPEESSSDSDDWNEKNNPSKARRKRSKSQNDECQAGPAPNVNRNENDSDATVDFEMEDLGNLSETVSDDNSINNTEEIPVKVELMDVPEGNDSEFIDNSNEIGDHVQEPSTSRPKIRVHSIEIIPALRGNQYSNMRSQNLFNEQHLHHDPSATVVTVKNEIDSQSNLYPNETNTQWEATLKHENDANETLIDNQEISIQEIFTDADLFKNEDNSHANLCKDETNASGEAPLKHENDADATLIDNQEISIQEIFTDADLFRNEDDSHANVSQDEPNAPGEATGKKGSKRKETDDDEAFSGNQDIPIQEIFTDADLFSIGRPYTYGTSNSENKNTDEKENSANSRGECIEQVNDNNCASFIDNSANEANPSNGTGVTQNSALTAEHADAVQEMFSDINSEVDMINIDGIILPESQGLFSGNVNQNHEANGATGWSDGSTDIGRERDCQMNTPKQNTAVMTKDPESDRNQELLPDINHESDMITEPEPCASRNSNQNPETVMATVSREDLPDIGSEVKIEDFRAETPIVIVGRDDPIFTISSDDYSDQMFENKTSESDVQQIDTQLNVDLNMNTTSKITSKTDAKNIMEEKNIDNLESRSHQSKDYECEQPFDPNENDPQDQPQVEAMKEEPEEPHVKREIKGESSNTLHDNKFALTEEHLKIHQLLLEEKDMVSKGRRAADGIINITTINLDSDDEKSSDTAEFNPANIKLRKGFEVITISSDDEP